MESIHFLTVDEVIAFHDDQIDRFGGLHGIRDFGLLESSVHMPQSGFSGKRFYQDVLMMGAIYAHGIIKNHPFFDGNKRAGILSSLIFLTYNSVKLSFREGELYALGIGIAASKINRGDIARIFKAKLV